MTKPYGYELILDLHGCNPRTFKRRSLRNYYIVICDTIDMERCKLTFWDDRWTWLWKLIFFWDKSIQAANEPHTKGISAVQFIITSNITIHCLTDIKKVFVNIFSCKPFNPDIATETTKFWFDAESCKRRFLHRE